MKKKAIIVLSKKGFELAGLISKHMEGVDIYLPKGKGFKNISSFSFSKVLDVSKKIFSQYDLIIYIMASGIVVRSIAGLIKNKKNDPAVLVIDEVGNFVISLLSGHLGGANDYARFISSILKGSVPVITTASDVHKKPAVDLVFDSLGFYVLNPKVLPKISYRIINEQKIFVYDPTKRLEKYLDVPGVCFVLDIDVLRKVAKNELFCIFVSHREIHEFLKCKNCLTVRPKNLVLGIGCKRDVDFNEVEEKILNFLNQENISVKSIKNLTTIDIKKDEVAINQFSKKYNLPVIYFSKDELNSVESQSIRSEKVKKLIGVNGVCEQAVILCKAKIIVSKKKLKNLTLALGVES